MTDKRSARARSGNMSVADVIEFLESIPQELRNAEGSAQLAWKDGRVQVIVAIDSDDDLNQRLRLYRGQQ